MAFEVYDKNWGGQNHIKHPYLSICKNGIAYFSIMDEPGDLSGEFWTVLVDKNSHKLALRPSRKDEFGMKVRKATRGVTRQIMLKGVASRFGLVTPQFRLLLSKETIDGLECWVAEVKFEEGVQP